MLGLSSAFFGQNKSDIQTGLHSQKREVTSVLSASGLGSSDVVTSLARKLATADSTLAQTSETSAQTQLYAASVSTITLSLPQSGARVAETRECAKSAADAATAALASVMQAKAELHSRQDAASAAARADVDAYNAKIAVKIRAIEDAVAGEIANVNRCL